MKLKLLLIILLFLTTACVSKQANFNVPEEAVIQDEEPAIELGLENNLDILEEPKSVSANPPAGEAGATADKEEGILEKATNVVKELFVSEKAEEDLPQTFEFKVAFASQAPFANWDMPFKEACEEASMIMAARYFKEQALNESIMKDEILKLVDWEEKRGYKVDMTAAESAHALEDYFDLKAELSYEVTIDKIKEELVDGKLIIIPAAGRQLGNPYFQNPGPLYHMLVITGYDRNEFITNDPGTKRGEGFKYKYDVLINAIHDWNGGDVENGRKVMILVGE